MEKSRDALRTISEVADWLGVPTHVLRFWESRFSQIRPVKRAGGRRYYRPSDMALLGGIRKLLYDDGMTIRGVQKILREKGVGPVAALTPESGGETRGSEVDVAASHPRDPTADPDMGSGRSKPGNRENGPTKRREADPARSACDPEPQIESRTPSADQRTARVPPLGGATLKQAGSDRIQSTARTRSRDESKGVAAADSESGGRALASGAHPPRRPVADSVSPPGTAETGDGRGETTGSAAGARPGSVHHDSVSPSGYSRGAPDRGASRSDSNESILDLYNRLLALRNRMARSPYDPAGRNHGQQ